MKTSLLPAVRLLFVAMIATALGLSGAGCASHKSHNTESLLSAAGFHTLTPSTPQQQNIYDTLPPYKVQRHEIKGKVVYAYKDPKQGIIYVGGEQQYQRYQQLAVQEKIAQDQLAAAQMNENAAMNWGYWGPSGMWW